MPYFLGGGGNVALGAPGWCDWPVVYACQRQIRGQLGELEDANRELISFLNEAWVELTCEEVSSAVLRLVGWLVGLASVWNEKTYLTKREVGNNHRLKSDFLNGVC